jgi:hypothetical protein
MNIHVVFTKSELINDIMLHGISTLSCKLFMVLSWASLLFVIVATRYLNSETLSYDLAHI